MFATFFFVVVVVVVVVVRAHGTRFHTNCAPSVGASCVLYHQERAWRASPACITFNLRHLGGSRYDDMCSICLAGILPAEGGSLLAGTEQLLPYPINRVPPPPPSSVFALLSSGHGMVSRIAVSFFCSKPVFWVR